MTSAMFFFFGLAAQPYIQLAMEWWTLRPRNVTTQNYWSHCRGCTL